MLAGGEDGADSSCADGGEGGLGAGMLGRKFGSSVSDVQPDETQSPDAKPLSRCLKPVKPQEAAF